MKRPPMNPWRRAPVNDHTDRMIIILMGVSGSGKSTVGRLLADSLAWPFYDGDDFHPEENVAKMGRGMPLTDVDRQAWLKALRDAIDALIRDGRSAVIACSALKRAYRAYLDTDDEVVFVYLKGDFELIRQRMAARKGHFFKPALLATQFATLEEPAGSTLTVSIAQPPEGIVSQIRTLLSL